MKVKLLQEYCKQYGMIINPDKTRFFVVNSNERDRQPLVVNSLVIDHCQQYTYLGSVFTSDGSASSAVKSHAKAKISHVLKYVSFVDKNNDIPFIVKRRVLDAALMSGLLYGCESWLCADLKPVMKLYNWAIKQLLGVRKNTASDICYAEAGYPSLPDLVRYKQHKFFYSMWEERQGMIDDPLRFAIEATAQSNTPVGKIVHDMINIQIPQWNTLMVNVQQKITRSHSSRFVTYKDINPPLTVHPVYTVRHTIKEHHRKAFTQFRVSGHSLCIETGRWNRRGRGRLPPEERLCGCGQVQTERHVAQHCPLSQTIRDAYHFSTLDEVFSERFDSKTQCKLIYEILEIYK